MKINMNRRGFLKVTGAAATTVVAPTALANIGETYYVECVELSGLSGVQYYNRDSERFKEFYANRSENWRLNSLSREQMANNLGEHVVEFFDANLENYILSSSPGDSLAFVVSTHRLSEFSTSNFVIEKMAFKENHKVWGLS